MLGSKPVLMAPLVALKETMLLRLSTGEPLLPATSANRPPATTLWPDCAMSKTLPSRICGVQLTEDSDTIESCGMTSGTTVGIAIAVATGWGTAAAACVPPDREPDEESREHRGGTLCE
ncbi:hypothetical protein BJF82_12885 [Kytococcus sp. CUA-901]|nr:hypothetical protein BJF82_12885 [Kytococcus sp. CUA-901]